MKNALVNLVNISKSFDNQMVLDDLNLYIRENEFLTLFCLLYTSDAADE